MHSITALSMACGVNADTIRSWERRYAVVYPYRDDNGRRLYSDADVDRLKLIAKLVKAGHAIGKLAPQDTDELVELSGKMPEDETSLAILRVVEQLNAAIDSGDHDRFRAAVRTALLIGDAEQVAERVLGPTLRRIGALWQEGRIDIGQEHAFSAIIKQQLLALIGAIDGIGKGPVIVLTTLSRELHEIGALMACHIAAARGWRCRYFGPNLPADDIVASATAAKARVVALSAVHALEDESGLAQLRRVSDRLPKSIDLWLGLGPHAAIDQARLPQRIAVFTGYQPFVRQLDLVSASR